MTAIGTRHPRWVSALAVTWLAVSALWLVVIVITDIPAWPLAIWIAATAGPLAVLANRRPRSSTRADT